MLEALRKEIDEIDSKLVHLLNDRANVSINIGLAKENTNIHVPAREQAVYDKILKLNQGPLTKDSIHAIYREIMSASIHLQKQVSVAFLGPSGSYSHQAALDKFGQGVTYSSQSTISDVFKAVDSELVTYAIIPFENSTFGSVVQTLDCFKTTTSVVRDTLNFKINHCLLSHAKTLPEITRVYSHPEALGQCTKWLDAHLPKAERIPSTSTSKAAEIASKDQNAASISSLVCSSLFCIPSLVSNIQDSADNTTRFFVLGLVIEAKTGKDKSLISFTLDHRQPGALCDTLAVLKKYGVNLTRIDSRPSGIRNWHYIFFVEMEGHVADEEIKQSLLEMPKFCLDIKVLGSYRGID